jgi:uncharacterized membrane protein
MHRHATLFFAGGLVAAAAAGTAPAQDAFARADTCLKEALTLAERAEGRNLSEAQLDRIEALLSLMEDHCDTQRFEEAASVARELTRLIDEP